MSKTNVAVVLLALVGGCYESHRVVDPIDGGVGDAPPFCEPGTLSARWLGAPIPAGPYFTEGPVAHQGSFYILRLRTDEFEVHRVNMDGTLTFVNEFNGEAGAIPRFQSNDSELIFSRHPSDGRGNRRLVVTTIGERLSTWSVPIPSYTNIVPTSLHDWLVVSTLGVRRMTRDGRWTNEWQPLVDERTDRRGVWLTPAGNDALVTGYQEETVSIGRLGTPFEDRVRYRLPDSHDADVIAGGSRALDVDTFASLLDRPAGLVIAVYGDGVITRSRVTPTWERESPPQTWAMGGVQFVVAWRSGDALMFGSYDATAVREGGPTTELALDTEARSYLDVSAPVDGTVMFRARGEFGERFGLLSRCE